MSKLSIFGAKICGDCQAAKKFLMNVPEESFEYNQIPLPEIRERLGDYCKKHHITPPIDIMLPLAIDEQNNKILSGLAEIKRWFGPESTLAYFDLAGNDE